MKTRPKEQILYIATDGCQGEYVTGHICQVWLYKVSVAFRSDGLGAFACLMRGKMAVTPHTPTLSKRHARFKK